MRALKSIQIRRDKFHGHFDKDYFFDRERLQREASITWNELDDARDVMVKMLNDYSVDFDGNMFQGEVMNVDDLTHLLHAARKGSK